MIESQNKLIISTFKEAIYDLFDIYLAVFKTLKLQNLKNLFLIESYMRLAGELLKRLILEEVMTNYHKNKGKQGVLI